MSLRYLVSAAILSTVLGCSAAITSTAEDRGELALEALRAAQAAADAWEQAESAAGLALEALPDVEDLATAPAVSNFLTAWVEAQTASVEAQTASTNANPRTAAALLAWNESRAAIRIGGSSRGLLEDALTYAERGRQDEAASTLRTALSAAQSEAERAMLAWSAVARRWQAAASGQ